MEKSEAVIETPSYRAKIIHRKHDGSETKYILKMRTAIGRLREFNDIAINSTKVSKFHSKISFEAQK
jgi:hypothetical protein